MVTLEHDVEALAQLYEHANGFETGHCHEYAKEEEYGAHIDARQHVGHAFLHSTLLLGMAKVAVEYFAHRPKHAQHEQYAYKRGQMGNALEYGYKDEATHAQEEYYLAPSSHWQRWQPVVWPRSRACP